MARRYSVCADDAQDAYQRGLEILMRHSARLDADRAGGWLHTVVKHEALAINRSRRQLVSSDEVDLDTFEVRTEPSPEEQVIGFERVARSAEALQRLKPQEVRALWLKSMGNSYQEICEATGWSYTKVNRCLAEGRKSFLARYAGIEAGEECKRWAPVLSAMVDGEATAEQLMQLRPHLRNCPACRATVRELRGSNAPLVALFPVGGLAMGGGAFGGAGDLVERLWHSLWGDLTDRAASSAVRAQSIVEAVASGRVAATAASVVALAGGGVALEQAVRSGAPAARPVATSSAPAAAGGSAAAGAPAGATVKFAATRIKGGSTRATAGRTAIKKARTARARQRAVVRRPSTRGTAAVPASTVRRAALVAPARTSPAASPARVAAVTTPVAAATPARAASPAPHRTAAPRGTDGGEFSLERP
jgi:RNA polymerase sigma factor (sigma-70 family)